MSTATETKNGKPEATTVNRVADYIDNHAEERAAGIRQFVLDSANVRRALKIEGARIEDFEDRIADNIDTVFGVMVQATSGEIIKKTVVRDGKLCRVNATVYKLDPMRVYLGLSDKIPATFIRDGEGFDTPAHKQYTDRLVRMMVVCFGVFAQEFAGMVCDSSEKRDAAKAYAAGWTTTDPTTGKAKATPIGLEVKSDGGTTVGSARAKVIAKLRGNHNR